MKTDNARYCTSVAAVGAAALTATALVGTGVADDSPTVGCEQTGNCDRDRELRSCDHYESLLLELDQSYVVFGTPVIVTNLAIAGYTANVGVRLASFYWA